MASILVVDDEAKMRHILKIMLEMQGHSVEEASNGREALDVIEEKPLDLVIADIRMPEMDGLQLLGEVQKMDIPLPVVFITAFATIESAVEAMKQGAADYITKPFEEQRLLLTVQRVLGVSRIMRENRELREQLTQISKEGEIICASKSMRQVLDLAKRVAMKPGTTVLITGESGTGKEIVARYIHDNSPRCDRRFVAVNCAAIAPNLVESTLFGHEKGAFTGADKRKEGVFEYAAGGTLFLDEIGDLPLDIQAKLLRALQEKTIQRVGGNAPIKVDVRVVCATNRNLEELVEKGDFRADLYYRINVFPIHIPSLRERRDDIIPLAEHFVRRFRDRDIEGEPLTQGAKRVLLDHNWPGNVRELANAMERAVILAGDEVVTAEHLAFLKPQTGGTVQWSLPPEGLSLEELEKELIRQALEMTNHNQSAAARLLRLTRSKFRTRVKQLEE